MNVRLANTKDVEYIVTIHEQAFPKFFLTKLGRGFLCLYYRNMCKSKGAITLCAEKDGKIVGFSTTALTSAGFNRRLIKDNLFEFTIEGIKLLFIKPMDLWHLIKNFTKKADGIVDDGNYAELFSIGVDPSCQGKGIGRSLLMETETIVMRSARQISLTTDKNNNESTIAFYQRCGYRILYEFTAYPDREMYRFIKDLDYFV